MLIEIELAALIALQAAALFRREKAKPEPPTPAPAKEAAAVVLPVVMQRPHLVDELQVLKRVDGDWRHIGYRHSEHPDIAEALATPGLAVRHADGRIEVGQQ